MSEKIVQLNEEVVKGQIKELVRGTQIKELVRGTNQGIGPRQNMQKTKRCCLPWKRQCPCPSVRRSQPTEKKACFSP